MGREAVKDTYYQLYYATTDYCSVVCLLESLEYVVGAVVRIA